MTRKRSPTWARGAPRAESVNPGTGGTADVDIGGARTVEGTSDRSGPPGGTFTPVHPPTAESRKWPLSGEATSALVAAIVLVGAIILYVAGIKSDVAIVSTRVDALQKS